MSSVLGKLNRNRDKWTKAALFQDEKGPELQDNINEKLPPSLYETTKDDVKAQIKQLELDSIEDDQILPQAVGKLSAANDSLHTWRLARRKNKTGMANAGLQHILYTINTFLEGFSGIADIVKAADQMGGGLAYGTISLLVTVAAKKQQREEKIEEALEELGYAFPRLQTLSKLQPNESLRGLILEVFEMSIVFCREIIDYFASRSRRLGQAVSPKAWKEATLSRIRSKLFEIHKDCEINLLVQMEEMKKELEEIRLTGLDTNARIRRGNTRADGAALESMRNVLGLEKKANETFRQTDNEKLRHVLDNEFSDHQSSRKAPCLLSMEILNSDKKFSEWKQCKRSSLLILGGSNLVEDPVIQLNWLSHAATLFSNSKKNAHPDEGTSALLPQEHVLFFTFQWDHILSHRQRSTFSEMVGHLIYQLAELLPGHLEGRIYQIREALRSQQWHDEVPGEAFGAHVALLMDLLARAPNGSEFFILIDRLDRCRWSDDQAYGKGELEVAVRALLDLASRTRNICIKVLVILDGETAKALQQRLASLRSPSLQWRLAWDQMPLDF